MSKNKQQRINKNMDTKMPQRSKRIKRKSDKQRHPDFRQQNCDQQRVHGAREAILLPSAKQYWRAVIFFSTPVRQNRSLPPTHPHTHMRLCVVFIFSCFGNHADKAVSKNYGQQRANLKPHREAGKNNNPHTTNPKLKHSTTTKSL